MIDPPMELAHVALAVADLDEAMALYGLALGDRWTAFMEVDQEWLAPLEPSGTIHARGRGVWALASEPPLELWEGAPGSPWHVPAGEQRLHHLSYWADDLVARTEELERAGFVLEHALPSASGARLAGFAYLRHPSGTRIELQSVADKAGLARWAAGGAHDGHTDT